MLDDSDEVDMTSGKPVATPRPEFRIQRRPGELTLSGHTLSRTHEQDLLQVAASSYPNDRVINDFQPLGIVPDTWADTTAQVSYLLQETTSADAVISANEILIRGVIISHLSWQSRLDAFRKALPANISISADTVLVDPAISVAAICGRAFESFDTGPINFEESSTEFRSSAYPRLDRLIALANACENSRLSITGHTDASGNEAWNRQLSIKRASAVGDYIETGGIDAARLQISGVGSAEPIADDGTRYGRSLNRRIEIALSGNY
jgi:OOP family OmpA-OmpF porin